MVCTVKNFIAYIEMPTVNDRLSAAALIYIFPVEDAAFI